MASRQEVQAELERKLAQGGAKLDQMAAATDEEFDELWAEAKDAWHDLSQDVETGKVHMHGRGDGSCS
jgi:hypothetical protein